MISAACATDWEKPASETLAEFRLYIARVLADAVLAEINMLQFE